MPTARLDVTADAGEVALRVSGRLDAAGAGAIWRATLVAAGRARGRTLRFDLSAMRLCDTAGATLLLAAEATHGGTAQFDGLSESAAALLLRLRPLAPATAPPASPPTPGRWQARLIADAVDAVAFLGEAVLAVLALPRRARMLRPRDLLRMADAAGVGALPLALLLGFLLGLILAFQSVIPLRRFGADIFVADLVSISVLRELGALLAAVIVAGRTGSAYAAEIGTMKVNQELDALFTMGLDAMTFLVLPRVIAVVLVMPALTLALDLAALAGMTVAMRAFGFPLAAVLHEVAQFATLRDALDGLGKALVFAAANGAIGCAAGLAAGSGPRAVGEAATRAVVGGIVATIVIDGLFALILYRLRS